MSRTDSKAARLVQVRHFHHVVALAEHRNFRRAAEAIGITQPALTQSIRMLESAFGVELFERSQRGVQLTDYGSIFLSAAKETLVRLSHLEREIGLLANLHSGHLIIGCDTLVSEAIIGRVLAAMISRHPTLRYSVRVGPWDDMLERLKACEIDFYVGSPPQRSDILLKETPIRMPSMVMVCRPQHPLTRKRKVNVSDCLDYPIVSARRPAWFQSWLERALPSEEISLDAFTVEVDDYGVIKWIVRHTDALAGALPAVVELEISTGALTRLNVEGLDFPLPASILTLADRPISDAANAAIQEILEQLASPA